MAYDTWAQIWRRVLLRCPSAPPLLVQDWATNAFRRLNERRLWSFDTAFQQLLFHDEVVGGAATLTFGSNVVQGDITAQSVWSAAGNQTALVGRQFRLGLNTPIYDIIAYNSAPPISLTLGDVWGGATVTAGYEIYNAYLTVPADFKSFQSVYDPTYNFQLATNRYTQQDLNVWDAQRASAGNPYTVVFRDYDPTGVTSPPRARYEVWPHRKSQYVLPYLYVVQPPDLSDAGATLPPIVRGDIIVEGALADCATWPGPDPDHRNPYFSALTARYHADRFERMVGELERQDDELFEQDLRYQSWTSSQWAPFPGDARFWQSHLLGASASY